jgi:hypothetical protein
VIQSLDKKEHRLNEASEEENQKHFHHQIEYKLKCYLLQKGGHQVVSAVE